MDLLSKNNIVKELSSFTKLICIIGIRPGCKSDKKDFAINNEDDEDDEYYEDDEDDEEDEYYEDYEDYEDNQNDEDVEVMEAKSSSKSKIKIKSIGLMEIKKENLILCKFNKTMTINFIAKKMQKTLYKDIKLPNDLYNNLEEFTNDANTDFIFTLLNSMQHKSQKCIGEYFKSLNQGLTPRLIRHFIANNLAKNILNKKSICEMETSRNIIIDYFNDVKLTLKHFSSQGKTIKLKFNNYNFYVHFYFKFQDFITILVHALFINI